MPLAITAALEVVDINQQTLKSNNQFLLHPSDYYVGLYVENSNIYINQPFEVEVIVSDRGKLTNYGR